MNPNTIKSLSTSNQIPTIQVPPSLPQSNPRPQSAPKKVKVKYGVFNPSVYNMQGNNFDLHLPDYDEDTISKLISITNDPSLPSGKQLLESSLYYKEKRINKLKDLLELNKRLGYPKFDLAQSLKQYIENSKNEDNLIIDVIKNNSEPTNYVKSTPHLNFKYSKEHKEKLLNELIGLPIPQKHLRGKKLRYDIDKYESLITDLMNQVQYERKLRKDIEKQYRSKEEECNDAILKTIVDKINPDKVGNISKMSKASNTCIELYKESQKFNSKKYKTKNPGSSRSKGKYNNGCTIGQNSPGNYNCPIGNSINNSKYENNSYKNSYCINKRNDRTKSAYSSLGSGFFNNRENNGNFYRTQNIQNNNNNFSLTSSLMSNQRTFNCGPSNFNSSIISNKLNYNNSSIMNNNQSMRNMNNLSKTFNSQSRVSIANTNKLPLEDSRRSKINRLLLKSSKKLLNEKLADISNSIIDSLLYEIVLDLEDIEAIQNKQKEDFEFKKMLMSFIPSIREMRKTEKNVFDTLNYLNHDSTYIPLVNLNDYNEEVQKQSNLNFSSPGINERSIYNEEIKNEEFDKYSGDIVKFICNGFYLKASLGWEFIKKIESNRSQYKMFLIGKGTFYYNDIFRIYEEIVEEVIQEATLEEIKGIVEDTEKIANSAYSEEINKFEEGNNEININNNK